MLFNSLHYLVFLPVVTAVFFALRGRARRLFLLGASFYFYAVFSLPLCLLLLWAAVLDFSMALVIHRFRARPRAKRLALVASLAGNLTPLLVFKYLDFLSLTLAGWTGHAPWPLLNLVLPLGISFYTFETISYTVDVYRGKLEPTRDFVDYLLFLTYFPHLVAGPILRAGEILPQFREAHAPNAERMLSGGQLVVWGLLKKLFVADPMGSLVGAVYGTAGEPVVPETLSGAALLLGTYAFAAQIYCDFSAYSDIAIGSGRILGFRIERNFDAPYLATSLRDFWRRWHISLSTWLRDYLYIPLGGSRGGRLRTHVNLMVTMLLGGLWHGASWNFVIWGGLHGLYLIAERGLGAERVDPAAPAWQRAARGLLTFHLVCLAWVFFRAQELPQALAIVRGILTWQVGARPIGLAPLAALALITGVQLLRRCGLSGERLLQWPRTLRWALYAAVALIVTALAGGRSPEFIYFQF